MKSVKKLQIGIALTLLIILGIAQTSPANEPTNFLDKLTPFSATKLLKTFTNISDNHDFDGSKTYDVSHFTGLGIAVTMDVIVNMGNQIGVRIEGDEAAIEDLIVEVKGNNLVIRTRETWKLWQKKHAHTKLKAVISAKQLSSISMASSGNIKVNNTIQTKQLAINI